MVLGETPLLSAATAVIASRMTSSEERIREFAICDLRFAVGDLRFANRELRVVIRELGRCPGVLDELPWGTDATVA
jgi:hypothetical protein